MQSQVERLDLIRQKLDEKKTISTREIMKMSLLIRLGGM